MGHVFSLAAAAVAALVLGVSSATADAPNDKAALAGITEIKVAFDVQNGDPKALLRQLEVIDETRQSLINQGVKPSFVITFRGPATKLTQTDQSQIKLKDREDAGKVAAKIKALRSAEGVAGLEQCAVAVRLAGTNPEKVLPDIKLVGNGWISLMAYQARGYGYIAP